MLDLQSRVHFQKVKVPVLIDQELDRPRIDVAGGAGDAAGSVAETLSQIVVDERRRRFLDELLVSSLDRALALAQVDHVTVLVAEDLDLDVPRLGDVALQIDGAVAERGLRLSARQPERAVELGGRRDEPHALAAAAHRRLDHDRIADRRRRRARILVRGERLDGARHHRHADLASELARRRLVAHRADRRWRWADEDESRFTAGLGECGVLREKAIAGMDRIRARGLRHADELLDREIALGGRRRPDRIRLVGHQDVQRLAIDVGEHRDGGDLLLAAGAEDTHGDLAAVGDQNFGEPHERLMIADAASVTCGAGSAGFCPWPSWGAPRRTRSREALCSRRRDRGRTSGAPRRAAMTPSTRRSARRSRTE